MRTDELDIPEFLLRFPPDPAREAAVSAAWDRRWAIMAKEPYRPPLSIPTTMEDDDMVSLVRLDLSKTNFVGDNPLAKLGRGQREVKVLAVSDKWARFDAGPVTGSPITVRREDWDAIPKETLMTNVQSDVQTTTNGAGAEPSAETGKRTRKAAGKKAAPEKKAAGKKVSAPETGKKATGKKAAAPAKGKAKKAADGKPSNKSVMLGLFRANVGKPLSYEKLCMAVYKTKDNPGGFAGVLRGCEMAAEEAGHSIERAGKGKEATYTYRHKKAA